MQSYLASHQYQLQLFWSMTVIPVYLSLGEILHVCFFRVARDSSRNGSEIHNDDNYSNAALALLLHRPGNSYGLSRVSLCSAHSEMNARSSGSGSGPTLLSSSHADKNSSSMPSHFLAQLVKPRPSSLA